MLDAMIEKYPSQTRTHLDLACGTGYAVAHFEKHGYQSIGVDASVPMLIVGRKRAPNLVAGDLRTLPLRTTFARITCLYDSLNHFQTTEDLVAAFSCVRSAMSADSLFFFDVNHPDIYPAVWGLRDPYVSTGIDHHLEIATTYSRREKRAHGLVTGWVKLPNGERVAIREAHTQRPWSEDEIGECLRAAGLDVVEVIDFDPFQEIDTVDAQGVKLFFVCGRT